MAELENFLCSIFHVMCLEMEGSIGYDEGVRTHLLID